MKCWYTKGSCIPSQKVVPIFSKLKCFWKMYRAHLVIVRIEASKHLGCNPTAAGVQAPFIFRGGDYKRTSAHTPTDKSGWFEIYTTLYMPSLPPPPLLHLPLCVLLPRGQADHVPLEDELEALCCLHAARAELVLSGDVEGFLERASMLEAFSFREEEEDGDTDNEVVTDVPPPTSLSLSGGDGDGPGQAGVERDGSRRRLAALENCLDAFERLVVTILRPNIFGELLAPNCLGFLGGAGLP